MIWSLFIGLIVGIIAKFLMPGKDPGGSILTILLGIAGAAFAHWMGVLMGAYNEGEPVGLIASVIGAMLILWFYRLVFKAKA